jgi:hypothetical protein
MKMFHTSNPLMVKLAYYTLLFKFSIVPKLIFNLSRAQRAN